MGTKYNFIVKTGDQHGAGTDSGIYVILYGDRGITEEKRLNGYVKEKNAFVRNDTNNFDVEFDIDAGDIYQINVRSDMRYSAGAWLCSSFTIKKERSKASSRFQIDKWIEDTITHIYIVTSGFNTTVPAHEDIYLEVYGATHYIAAETEATIECEAKLEMSIDYSKVNIIDTSTNASVEGSYGAIKAAIETEIRTSIENQIGHKLGYIETAKTTTKVPMSHNPRALTEIWQLTNYSFSASMGSDTYNFSIPAKRVFAGFKEKSFDLIYNAALTAFTKVLGMNGQLIQSCIDITE